MLAAAPVHAGLGARNEILAKGLKAVGKWLETHTLDCGWEDGAFMLGELSGTITLVPRTVAYEQLCNS